MAQYVDEEDDDECKLVWPSGLWATSQGDETAKTNKCTQPFIEALWQSTYAYNM